MTDDSARASTSPSRIPIQAIDLPGGKSIPFRYFKLLVGDRIATGSALKVLQTVGMPRDLKQWGLIIDGEGIDKPDFIFHFLGVITPDHISRPDAKSPMPFILQTWNDKTQKPVAFKFSGFMWERIVSIKNSTAELREIHDPNGRFESESQTGWALRMANLASNDLTVKERANLMRKLAQGYELMVGLWEAVSAQHSGRKSAAKPDSETIPRWSGEYEEAHKALKGELQNRRSKWLSRYTEADRKTIIKRSLNDPPREVKDSLAQFKTISEVALQYAAWRCSKIPVGTWQQDRLRDVLQESDRLNGIDRSRSRN